MFIKENEYLLCTWCISSVQFSHSVMSNSLRPHGLQHTRLSCLSLPPRVCSNSWPLNQWCYLTISSSATPFSFGPSPSIFSSIGIFSNESSFCIRWPKYWSFRISPSNEYSGLISFKMDWFVFLAVQGTVSTTFQRHQFFGAQPFIKKSSSHIHTWLLEKPYLWLNAPLLAKWCLCF